MTINIPDFTQGRVLVVGDIMLDRYWHGATTRISPEAPVPVVKIGDTENRLGGAANVARNIRALGCETSLFGIVGKDTAGDIVRQLLDESGIKHDLHIDDKNPTITKLRVMSQHQQLIRLDFEEKLHGVDKNVLLAELELNINNFDIVVISDYAKGTITNASSIIELCKQHNIQVLVDPKGSDFSQYCGATLITPNRSELEIVVGECDSLETLFNEAEKFRAKLDLHALMVTLSEKGMVLMEKGHAAIHIPTQARDVFDVTGAGDTVIATLAASMACNTGLGNAMRLANAAAGVVVGKIGTATVSPDELISAVSDQHNTSSQGVKTLKQLTSLAKKAKAANEKIVFTNGCFDILHAGHVRYLQQAAELGDRLIVGVNSNESVKNLKGPSRPINELASRMEVLSSLRCVDWVVSFDEDTPENLINELIPDFLVKGGDYNAEEIVGYDTVTTNGGEVVVMPFLDGHSTTAIIEKTNSTK